MTAPKLRRTNKEVQAEKLKKAKLPAISLEYKMKPIPPLSFPPSPGWKRGSYRTGDGDNYHQPQRPGSDHSHIKSFGEGT